MKPSGLTNQEELFGGLYAEKLGDLFTDLGCCSWQLESYALVQSIQNEPVDGLCIPLYHSFFPRVFRPTFILILH